MALRRYVLVWLLLLPAFAHAQRDPTVIIEELQKLAWQRGPGEGAIGAKAKILIPDGFSFLDVPTLSAGVGA